MYGWSFHSAAAVKQRRRMTMTNTQKRGEEENGRRFQRIAKAWKQRFLLRINRCLIIITANHCWIIYARWWLKSQLGDNDSCDADITLCQLKSKVSRQFAPWKRDSRSPSQRNFGWSVVWKIRNFRYLSPLVSLATRPAPGNELLNRLAVSLLLLLALNRNFYCSLMNKLMSLGIVEVVMEN